MFLTISNLIVTVTTLAITTLIGALYNSVTDYISLIGSFCSVIISFIVPGMIYIKSNDYPLSHWKNVTTIALVSFLSLLGFTSGVVTIVGMVNKAQSS